jgi:hypothetical protein
LTEPQKSHSHDARGVASIRNEKIAFADIARSFSGKSAGFLYAP